MTLENINSKVVPTFFKNGAKIKDELIKPEMYYASYPTDYMNELRMSGQRFKSIIFIDYWVDYTSNKKNSLRFYGKAWNKAPSTCKIWIDEFKKVIENFFGGWDKHNENTRQQPNNLKTSTNSDAIEASSNLEKVQIEQQSDKDYNKKIFKKISLSVNEIFNKNFERIKSLQIDYEIGDFAKSLNLTDKQIEMELKKFKAHVLENEDDMKKGVKNFKFSFKKWLLRAREFFDRFTKRNQDNKNSKTKTKLKTKSSIDIEQEYFIKDTLSQIETKYKTKILIYQNVEYEIIKIEPKIERDKVAILKVKSNENTYDWNVTSIEGLNKFLSEHLKENIENKNKSKKRNIKDLILKVYINFEEMKEKFKNSTFADETKQVLFGIDELFIKNNILFFDTIELIKIQSKEQLVGYLRDKEVHHSYGKNCLV